MFMTAPPSTAEPTSRPARDGAGVPERIAGLLRLLQLIVGFGKVFAESLHQCSPRDFRIYAGRYRRPDFAEILARIKRGLMLAAALEEKLLKRAKTGRDVVPVPYRWNTSHQASSGSAPKRTRVRHSNIVDMPADRLPTAEQIAAELRRRPIGAVLADICRDVGIRPGDLTTEQWKELHDAILEFGGDPIDVLFAESHLRLQPLIDAALGRKKAPAPADTGAADGEACPTGPPSLAKAA